MADGRCIPRPDILAVLEEECTLDEWRRLAVPLCEELVGTQVGSTQIAKFVFLGACLQIIVQPVPKDYSRVGP